MRKLALCLAASAALSGCASIGGDALVDTVALPPIPPGCSANPVSPSDTALCATINETRTSATNYRRAAQELDNANVAYGLTQTASAIAILGFGLFDAHPDNTSAATLAGAIATGMRQGVHPDRQRDILVDGVRGMTCVARRGAVFLGHAETGQRLRVQAQNARDVAAQARNAARAAPASERATAEAITAAADDLDLAIAEAMQVVRYRTGATLQVQEGHAVVETSVVTQLRAERPNYASIIEAIRAAATPAASPPATERPAAARALADWADYLRQQARNLRALTADGPGKAEFDAILNCIGQT